MGKRILLIQGHPDTAQDHLCHVLAEAYAEGAGNGGHEVRHTKVALLEFPILRSQSEWEHGALPPGLQQAQADIAWAEHIVLVFPLWLGDMPALFKGFLEQVARPGFAFASDRLKPFSKKPLAGRSARVIVTMGMPVVVYRWYFWSHSIKSLKRNVLRFVGIAPVKETLIGLVGNATPAKVVDWVSKLQAMGREAA